MNRLLWIVLSLIGCGLIILVLNHESSTTLGLENDAFGRTLSLSIWALVVAAGLFGSGMRIGEFARNLAIWMLVILGLVFGYQSRYELQDAASRLTAGFVPGSPISSAATDGRPTVMLMKLPTGHFEARASVNGQPVQVLVDTGATLTVLSFDDAERIGLQPGLMRYTLPVATANGTARAARTVVQEISVGTISRRNITVLVAESNALNQSLLGMNFIESLSGVDLRRDRMILHD